MMHTVTSKWARWRLKSPASRLFAHPFIQAQIKENIKAPRRHWPLWGGSTVTSQRASNAENVSIWWRHHDDLGNSFDKFSTASKVFLENRVECLRHEGWFLGSAKVHSESPKKIVLSFVWWKGWYGEMVNYVNCGESLYICSHVSISTQ